MNPLDYSSHNWLAQRINNESLRRHLGVLRGRVLDLGCGDAPYETDIVARSCAYVGVDWPRSLHGRSRVSAFADLGAPLPFRDECADTITAFQVLEHVPEPDATLAEMARVARRYLLVSVPREPMWRMLNMARGAYWGSLGNTPGHVNHWSRVGFVSLLTRHGKVEEIRSPFPWSMLLVRVD